ncbi:helix-turn-helix transcriptional regulator [Bdellovibrionota bacterium FG-2]
MKKPRTDSDDNVELVVRDRSARVFRLPREKMRGLVSLIREHEVKQDDQLISADEVFKSLYEKYGKVGTVIRGARAKEGLTQTELAKKLGGTQADISQMETSKRPVGKKMAHRLAEIFETDYRIFL